MSRKSIYKDIYVINVYELAKLDGMSDVKIAKAMGLSVPTFLKWKMKKPLFRYAYLKGKNYSKNTDGSSVSFQQYVYQRLPKKLRRLWRELNKIKGNTERIETLFAGKPKRYRQHLFLHAWISCNFNVSAACKKVNLSRSTLDKWIENDYEFSKLFKDIDWHKKNFFESSLCRLVQSGNSAATIFANRTYNRDRGYNEKQEISISGNINHYVVSMDNLDLPLEVKKLILENLRKTKRIESKETTQIPLLTQGINQCSMQQAI